VVEAGQVGSLALAPAKKKKKKVNNIPLINPSKFKF
jgi:hypothetical protein